MQDIDYIDGTASAPVMIGDKDEWNKGFATEARFLMLKFAFEERRLHRITDLVKEDNIRSIRLHKRCGYKVEGVLRHSIFRNGSYHNQVIMGLLKEDFEEAY